MAHLLNKSGSNHNQQDLQDAYRWKLQFDSYRDNLPVFYNDYMNSYMKFLKLNASLQVQSTE